MNVALIAAAGIGRRMGGQGKQYLLLGGEPMLAHTLRAFESCSAVQQIVVAAGGEDLGRCRELVKHYKFNKVRQVVEGGRERQDSIYNGLRALPEQTKVVAVHDGARPFVTSAVIEDCFSGLDGWDGVIAGVPAKDTLKRIEGEKVVETLDRQDIWQIQTPQVFPADLLVKAYKKAGSDGFYGTDDAVLMERLGYRIRIIMGSYENIKITTPDDVVIAEAILEKRKKTVER